MKNLSQSLLADKAAATEVAKDVAQSLGQAVRDEMNLAKAELKQATHGLKAHSSMFVAGCVAAIAGILPLMAFLVLGLSAATKIDYWLSSLIIGVIFTAGGGFAASRSVAAMKLGNVTLPRTRLSLIKEQEAISQKIQAIGSRRKETL